MRLVVVVPALGDRRTERRVSLEDRPVVVGGGADCDVTLGGLGATDCHLRFELTATGWTVSDLEGKGRWSVGGVRLRAGEPRLLRAGQKLVHKELALDVVEDEGGDGALDTREAVFVALARAAEAPLKFPRMRVVEGAHKGLAVDLEEGRTYLVGRAEKSDILLDGSDASREHLSVCWRGDIVVVRDLGGPKGSFLGKTRLEAMRAATWDATLLIRVPGAVMSLELPKRLAQLLPHVEDTPAVPPAPSLDAPSDNEEPNQPESHVLSSVASSAPVEQVNPVASPAAPPEPLPPRQSRWSLLVPIAVVAVGIAMLAIFVWILVS